MQIAGPRVRPRRIVRRHESCSSRPTCVLETQILDDPVRRSGGHVVGQDRPGMEAYLLRRLSGVRYGVVDLTDPAAEAFKK